jgi:uroporphyrinogen decarboxylase
MRQLKNDRVLRALSRQPVDVTPIWIMRQAGRYLPEYRETRKHAGDFMTLCKTPELACAVTLQPVTRFSLDAAILFSDILTIADAMGLGLSIIENQGPKFSRPIRRKSDIDKLAVPDPETELRYVMDAVRLIRKELNGEVPLIGFAGSPWTIGTYMIEGGGSKEFRHAKGMLYEDPSSLHRLLALLAESVTVYLNAQIAAGAQVVMIFDSWGGALSEAAFKEFSLAYIKQIVAGLNRNLDDSRIPVIVFTKGGGLWLEDIAGSGCDAIGVDWNIDIGKARQRVGGRVAIQGNLDPAVLYSDTSAIRSETARILAAYGRGGGHIFNLGHGIPADVDPENVAALVHAVHELSKPYHSERMAI